MRPTILFFREFFMQYALLFAACILGLGASLGIILSVSILPKSLEKEWVSSYAGIDAVLAPPTSDLQAVLSLVTQVDEPAGLIHREAWERFRRHPAVEDGYPVAFGDNYRGYRVVGIESRFFETFRLEDGGPITFAKGVSFVDGERTAVLGSVVAKELQFSIGNRFEPSHGFAANDEMTHKHFELEIIAVLEPTGTFLDRLILVPLETYYAIPGHGLASEGKVSGVWVELKARAAAMGLMLANQWNQPESGVRFAWPVGRILADFWDEIGWTRELMKGLALGVTLLCILVVVGILALLSERWRKPLAYLRILGMSRGGVFLNVILFGCVCQVLGIFIAFWIYAVVGDYCANLVNEAYLIRLDIWSPDPIFWRVPLSYWLISGVVFLIPAINAYISSPTDVIKEGLDG